MCGIVGAVAKRNIGEVLLEGLHRLEYRGYDSAGVSVINGGNHLCTMKVVGKVDSLEIALNRFDEGHIGIGHTRWATHGEATRKNAHPHTSKDTLSLVHNGIIEGYDKAKDFLQESGYGFRSDTDSEVLAHMIHYYERLASVESDTPDAFSKAVRRVMREIKGSYSIAVIHKDYPDTLIVARNGSPAVIGVGIGENYVASDVHALSPVTDRFIHLRDGECATVTADNIEIRNMHSDDPIDYLVQTITNDMVSTGKGNHKHYMLKEMYEQPDVFADTIGGRVTADRVLEGIALPKDVLKTIEHIELVACGTSYYAALVAQMWVEELLGMTCTVHIGSEYPYRETASRLNTLFITLSQSGETADTIKSLEKAKSYGHTTLAICNVPNSTLVNMSDYAMMINAGPEISVASTKSFTNQLGCLIMLVLSIRSVYSSEDYDHRFIHYLNSMPSIMRDVLSYEPRLAAMAEEFATADHALFLGRGLLFPVALEGALKMKELSYIHAEAYPTGELKHGPLALVDENMPVVVLRPMGDADVIEKVNLSIETVKSRGGKVFTIGNGDIMLPFVHRLLEPVIHAMAVQMLSYHVALIRGTDIDQPRNLAKSVTVE